MNMVAMTNETLEGVVIRVAASAVPFHMASGWVPLDDKIVLALEKEKADKAAAAAAADKGEDVKTSEPAKQGEAAAKPTKSTASKES
jgi:hypothetical protein